MSQPANDLVAPVLNACEKASAMMSGYACAASKANAAALQGFEDMMRNWGGWMHESVVRSVGAAKTLRSAKSPQEAADMHNEFLKDCFDSLMSGGSKISEISLRTAKSSLDPLTSHANQAMGTVMNAARGVGA